MENRGQATEEGSPDTMLDSQGFYTGITDAAQREITDLRDRTAGMAQSIRDEGKKAKTTALRLMVDEVDGRKVQLVDGLMARMD